VSAHPPSAFPDHAGRSDAEANETAQRDHTGLHALFVEAVRQGEMVGRLPCKPRQTWTVEYAQWRFLAALAAKPQGTSPSLDLGVLLRQVVRWSEHEPYVGSVSANLREVMAASGVAVSPAGRLSATPFIPDWLDGEAVDRCSGMDRPPVLRRPDERVPGEPWLGSLAEHEDWNSQAQKEGVWAALTSEPGSTTLVGLPTGAGKSLVFQLLARFSTGLTVVVVPTVSLAIDHCRSAHRVLGAFAAALDPRYFAAGDPENDPEQVVAAVRTRSCRLVFTSPEACVTGRLRNALEQGAREGWFENLVVDEAHIVDAWGGNFRVDFQMLSGLREQWVGLSDGNLRTFLLSATFTPECRTALRSLFFNEAAGSFEVGKPASGRGRWKEFVAQRLRPEMDYYAKGFSAAALRDTDVLEALRHLPRPAILYVTEKAEAERFLKLLWGEGYRRTGCFHGDTRPRQRRQLIEAWHKDQIDLMVATSAFGMGVDKQDVRTVLHACQPENLHRYYQEVGRGGRDGASTICLLMPTLHDRRVARELAPNLLGDEKLTLRWKAMWRGCRATGEQYIFDFPTDAKYDEQRGHQTFQEHIRWNKRLLLMLLRSGQIAIKDLIYEKVTDEDGETDYREWVRAEIFFPPSTDIAALVSRRRDEELSLSRRGLRHMEDHLGDVDSEAPRLAACRILRRQYGQGVQIACGGCRVCREEAVRAPIPVPPLEFSYEFPETPPSVSVVLSAPLADSPKSADELVRLIRSLLNNRDIRRFACPSSERTRIAEILARAFQSDGPSIYRLDVVGGGETTEGQGVGFSVEPHEHLICLHPRRPDPGLLALNRGKAVSHLFGDCALSRDANGRTPLVLDGARTYASAEAWYDRL